MHTQICTGTQALYTCTHRDTCTNTYIDTYGQPHIYTHTCTLRYTQTYMHRHPHRHTHKWPKTGSGAPFLAQLNCLLSKQMLCLSSFSLCPGSSTHQGRKGFGHTRESRSRGCVQCRPRDQWHCFPGGMVTETGCCWDSGGGGKGTWCGMKPGIRPGGSEIPRRKLSGSSGFRVGKKPHTWPGLGRARCGRAAGPGFGNTACSHFLQCCRKHWRAEVATFGACRKQPAFV